MRDCFGKCRMLNEADDREGAPPVAVISYDAWKSKFGGDASVVGAAFQIDRQPFTVVGVAAPGFFGADLRNWGMPDFWMPLSDEPLLKGDTSLLKTPDRNWLDIIGRVRPGTDPKALESQLKLELRQWQGSHLADMTTQSRDYIPKQVLYLSPGSAGVTDMREQYEDGLWLLLAAAGCVLLIACANLANLLLARGLRNRQQTSVRVALGASRARLVQKALAECLVLGLLGGAVSLGIAYAGTGLILRLAFTAPNSYVPIDAAPSGAVLLFALVLSLLTAMCFGVAPAWMTSHAEPVEALRGANRSTGTRTKWPQKALVVAQAAISLVLLSTATMLALSLRNLQHQRFGFETKAHYLVAIDPKLAGYRADQLEMLYRRLQERLQRIPGMMGVTAATYAPMSGSSWNDGVFLQGKPEPHSGQDYSASWTRVTPDFFSTLGNPILTGRPIGEQDTAASPQVAVINEAFATKFFKGENPIGRHFGMDEMNHAGDFEVIGVASDMRYLTYNLKGPDRAMFFLSANQYTSFAKPLEETGQLWSHYLYNIVLWASGNPADVEKQVRQALAEIDPNLTLENFSSYEETLRRDFGQQQLIAKLTLLFGALALVLAAVGIYGVTAYTVEQRTNEIGIRIALGANRSSALAMVLRGAFTQVAIGLAIGIPAAIGVGRAITSQMYAVKPYDPAILATAMLVLALTAFIAVLVPAQRAARVNPTEALRID
jgi:predicted permease